MAITVGKRQLSPGGKLFESLACAVNDLDLPDKAALMRVITTGGEFDELPDAVQEALEALASKRWV